MFSENNFRSSFHYVLLCVLLCIMCVYQIVILTLCEKGSSLVGVCRWSEGALQFRDANLANHSRPWLRTSFSGNVFFSIQIFPALRTTHPIGNTISKSYQSCYWHSETELTESVCLEVTAKTWDVKEDLIKRVVSLVACKREKLKGC